MSTERNPVGGGIFSAALGGMFIPEDSRYDAAYHNKDPWADLKIRKALNIAIDRQAICDAIFSGGASPVGAPLFSTDMNKYKYPYDSAAAKQLLKDAGYPNGFSFEAVSYVYPGVPETPRVVEALVGYWKQIGLDPKIKVIDYATFSKIRAQGKTAGMVSTQRISQTADVLEKAGTFFMPGSGAATYQDEGAYAIWTEGVSKVDAGEREMFVEKLNKYFYENYAPIPLIKIGACYAWNSQKISPWPHSSSTNPLYLDYVRHVEPINTFRLFTPWPER
jgi:ABC-type transport system substrate-binding protein